MAKLFAFTVYGHCSVFCNINLRMPGSFGMLFGIVKFQDEFNPRKQPKELLTCISPVNRDLKIRGREGQDGDGSGRGKLTRVPSCRQKQNT